MTKVTIEQTIQAPITTVREMRTKPEHITNRCFASDDWECPGAKNDLRVDGKFSTTFAAKDGSASFDFGGVYTDVQDEKHIAYTLEDDRKVDIVFEGDDSSTHITQTFDAENENPVEMQRAGWQSILDNFMKYVEGNK